MRIVELTPDEAAGVIAALSTTKDYSTTVILYGNSEELQVAKEIKKRSDILLDKHIERSLVNSTVLYNSSRIMLNKVGACRGMSITTVYVPPSIDIYGDNEFTRNIWPVLSASRANSVLLIKGMYL